MQAGPISTGYKIFPLFRYNFSNGGCSKTSVFGTVSLDLPEKPGFGPVFLRACPKLTGFWNKLNEEAIMTGKELLEGLDSDRAADVFTKLYGAGGVDGARKRYASLIEGMLKNTADWFPRTDFPEAAGDLRIFTAAGRTELGGNHTDHNRGKVLAASIQLDSVAIAAPRKDKKVFFRSTGYPDVIVDLSDLSPKDGEKGTTEALVRGIAAEFTARGTPVGGFTVNAASTVLPGSGLSSSAAVEVLLGRIFDCLYSDGKLSALEIARIGQKSENVYFGKPCGLMDQTACASGGAVAIDFGDLLNPQVRRIDFDLAAGGFALCVVDTRGSHVDLTPDYAAIPAEMAAVAAVFGKTVLREVDEEAVLSRAAEIRKIAGDRALLRSLHFFSENRRVDAMLAALEKMNAAAGAGMKKAALDEYLGLVNKSGDSSWELLQNIYSPQNPGEQGVSLALALTRNFLDRACGGKGACRVHGGGFAGTVQAYLPLDALEDFSLQIESFFGPRSVTVLRIRPVGVAEISLAP
jgi:galactokinase